MPWSKTRKVCLQRELGPHWRDLFEQFDEHPVGGGVDRPGPSGCLARDRVGPSRSRSSTRASARRSSPTSGRSRSASRAAALVARVASRCLHSSPSCAPACWRSSTTGARRPTSSGSPRRTPTGTATTSEAVVPARRARHLAACWCRAGWTASRWPESRRTGTQAERNRLGELYQRFLLSGPARCGLLHTDPHPGNFRLLDAPAGSGCSTSARSSKLPGGLPRTFGRLITALLAGDDDDVLPGAARGGLVRPGAKLEVAKLRELPGALQRAPRGTSGSTTAGTGSRISSRASTTRGTRSSPWRFS